MKRKSIWAHTLVKNEERFIWYAVMSVIDHVDKVLLWDTGSTDKTVEIIKEIQKAKKGKIDFREVGAVDPEQFTRVRQQMLDKTRSDWILIVDGDEVWWEHSIKDVINTIQEDGDHLETIVSPYYNIIGDIYHFQEEEAGMYKIDNKKGHINIRAINRKIPGMHLEKPHGQQGFYDNDGVLIQERFKQRRIFLDASYMHFTNMVRSSSFQADSLVPKRSQKFKFEIGINFPKDFLYPEIFYKQHPSIIPSPWVKMSTSYYLRATSETLFKKIKRKIFPTIGSGY